VVISRIDSNGDESDFVALSSVCPHLGCQVHWEGQNNRFFCPCHNGAFDPQGNAIAGPPKEAHQALARYPLKVENGLLFIQVKTQALV
jgi:Rieske Fe-S protein